MLVGYLKQKFSSIEIWRPILCSLFLISIGGMLNKSIMLHSTNNISFYEYVIECIKMWNILITLVLILFFMTNLNRSNKNTFDDYTILRLKSRASLVCLNYLYIAVLNILIILVLLISLGISYISYYGLTNVMFDSSTYHATQTGFGNIIISMSPENLTIMGLTPLKAFFTQIILFYLFMVLSGAVIYTINIFLKHSNLGFLVFMILSVLQIAFYYILRIDHQIGLFPYEHITLFYSNQVFFEVLFNSYDTLKETDRIAYIFSYMYYVGLTIFTLGINLYLIQKKDLMLVEGYR